MELQTGGETSFQQEKYELLYIVIMEVKICEWVLMHVNP